MTDGTGRVKTSVQLGEHVSAQAAVPMLAAVAMGAALGSGWPLALTGGLTLLLTLLILARVDRPRSYLPTLVTGIRGCIACALIAFGQSLDGPVVALGIMIVFALDGLDGYLARRMHSASVLGARLDMETDSLLVMGACTLLLLRGEMGAWVLTSGLLRYSYVLFVRCFGSRGEAPRSNFARYSFGLAVTGLTLGFLPLGAFTSAGPAFATTVLLYAFGRSFYWSLQGGSLQGGALRVSQSYSTSAPNEN